MDTTRNYEITKKTKKTTNLCEIDEETKNIIIIMNKKNRSYVNKL